MPLRNIKYDKSSMLQKDLPNANFICTDGDGLKFTPSAGDNKVTGLAQNTHHPQESNSILWNSVKLDWTRQAVGIYTNTLTANQANACEDGTTTGFSPAAATVSSSADYVVQGSKSLKLVANGTSGDSNANVGGDAGAIRLNMVPGKTYTFSAYEYVPSATGLSPNDSRGLKITFFWKESGGSYQSVSSQAPTATDTWQKLSVTKTLPENTVEAFIRLYNGFSTSGKANYWDKLMLEEGGTVHDWIAGGTSVPLTDFETVISLLGLTDGGEESLLGEKIITTCPIIETNEVINFDLSKSACQAQFTRESGTAAAGKIQLNLPKRYSNYENITLNRVWLDGWSKRKTALITGSSDGTLTYFQLDLSISYDNDMRSDFGDLRFMVWDGQKFVNCNYWISSYTPSSIAYFTVQIPVIYSNPATMNLYCFYGNSGATSLSNGDNTFIFFEDFNDNSLNMNKWQTVLGGGSAAVNETNQELQIRSDGSNRAYARSKNQYSGNYVLQFNAKKGENIEILFNWDGQITGAVDIPYNGYIFRYASWNNPTRFELVKYVNGVGSILGYYNFDLYSDGVYHSYWIERRDSWIIVWIDALNLFALQDTALNQGYIGFSARETPNAVNASYDVIRLRKTTQNWPTIGSFSGEESTTIILPDNCNWSDNFEDGKYNTRTGLAREWTNLAGTTSMESTAPINGNYSLKQAGGSNIHGIASINEVSTNYTVEFDAQLQIQGTLIYAPYVSLWYLRYGDASNFLRLDTYWDSGTSKQKLRLVKVESGTWTNIQMIDWFASKLSTGVTHHFKIMDTGTHVTIWVDDTQLINTDYTSNVSIGVKGVGASQDSVALFDNFVFTSNSIQSTDTSLKYTVPSDWTSGSPSYLTYKEHNGSDVKTPTLQLSNQNIATIGYNGLDAFDALRLKIESECNDDYTFKFNNFEYKYEI